MSFLKRLFFKKLFKILKTHNQTDFDMIIRKWLTGRGNLIPRASSLSTFRERRSPGNEVVVGVAEDINSRSIAKFANFYAINNRPIRDVMT